MTSCGDKTLEQSHPTRLVALGLLCVSFVSGLVGCAALTNPVANGVPAHMLPPELLGESREGYQQIPLSLLRQPPPQKYVLAVGDTLGIYIEGVLGDAQTPPPVNVPDSSELPPSIGYPFPIRENGTVSLPYVEPVKVAGMTIEQAEQTVIDAYIQKEIIRPDDRRILVTLLRPRYIRVLVIRDDSQQRQLSLQTQSFRGLGTTQTEIGGGNNNTGLVLELPAYQNDILNALARSGGLPGLESTQEVIVQRGYWNQSQDPNAAALCYPTEADLLAGADSNRHMTRIPMRTRDGEHVSINPADVILHNGDILIVKAREPEFYYTGGLMNANQYPLPNDYDLNIVEAVLKSQGPLNNGGLNSSNLNGNILSSGLGNPSPSLLTILRRVPTGGQVTIRVDLNDAMRDPRENILVQNGDVLILQETHDEATTRYFTQIFQTNFFFRWLDHADAQGTGSIVAP